MDDTRSFIGFVNDESGAVTVDWVVLTAGIVGLGYVVLSTVLPAVGGAGEELTTGIEVSVAAGLALN